MNDKPLFSVLIANYNDAAFINDALRSIDRQTYVNYEIVIVDDGSTDNSRQILESIKGRSNTRIYYNDTNYGCGYTKAKCISLAKGELCGFLDSDDTLTDNALEVMVRTHKQYPEASIVYSKYYYCNKDLSPMYISSHQQSIPKGSSFLQFKRGAISQFATFKKGLYDRTPGINKDLRVAEDLDNYFKLEEVGPTIFIDEPLYYYRNNTGNNTSTNKNVINAVSHEIIAKTDACHRRGLDTKTEVSMIEEIIQTTSNYLLSHSRQYKLGNCIVHPKELIKIIKSHIKK